MSEIIKDENNNYIKDTMPYEKYTDKNININNDIIEFYLKYNQLKNLYRQGWLKVRIGIEHKEKCESVADHSFSMALLALTIIEKCKFKIDLLKCLKMCIIHELGEVYIGDITPYDGISKDEKYTIEKNGVKLMLETLDFDNDFLELFEEFEEGKTDEAKFIKNLDQLEFLLQASAYGLKVECFEKCLSKLTDKYCIEIAKDLIKITKQNTPPKKIG